MGAKILSDICGAEGCPQPRKPTHGGHYRFCVGHRSRLSRHRDVRADVPLRPRHRPGDVRADKPTRERKIPRGGCAVPGCDRSNGRRRYCSSHYARLRKHGDVMADKPIRSIIPTDVCAVETCDRERTPGHGNGRSRYCSGHRSRLARRGDVMADIPLRPKHSGAFDEWCTYATAHRRVFYARGKASEHRCVDCAKPAQDWSYDGLSTWEFEGPTQHGYIMKWSGDPADYLPRCARCHKRHDRNLLGDRSAARR